MRENQIARHWHILMTLDSMRHGISPQELADTLQCNVRTIYRDIDALVEAGFPITDNKTDTGVRYMFTEQYRLNLKLHFSPMELIALHFAAQTFSALDGTVFHDSLDSIRKKVEATMTDRHREYAGAIENTFQATFRPARNYSNFREIIDAINNSLIEKRALRISYQSPNAREQVEREIEPYRLWLINGALYLIAYCCLRGEVRTFLVDRIKSFEVTERRYEIDKNFIFDNYTRQGFKALGGMGDYEVVVRVHPLLTPQMTEQTWHPTQKVEKLDDGWLRVSFHLNALDEIKSWVQGYAPYIIVERPPELIEEILEAFKSAIECYRDNA